MVIGPIIFVVTGIAGMQDMKKVGRVGGKALFYFEVVSTIALLIGLLLAHLFKPGANFNIDIASLDQNAVSQYAHAAPAATFIEFILNIIPETIFDAFSKGDILQILLISIIFGAALSSLGERGKLVVEVVDKISNVFFEMVKIITKLAPLGALGAMAFTIRKYGVGSLLPLIKLMATFYFTAILFIVVVLGGIARFVRFNIFRYLVFIKEELLIVLGTSSSESALPQLMQKLEKMGCSKSQEQIPKRSPPTTKLYLIVYIDPAKPEAYASAKRRLQDLAAKLHDYLAAVAKAKEAIAEGELMQVQVGQRISKPYRDAPLSLYRALRSINPSPYMYYYNFGDFQIVGASPEILVRQEVRASAAGDKQIVTIRPLAGTRPRGATPELDEKLATELLEDPKEIAEHVMLIDLARNDVGRIAKTGTVVVTEKMAIEKYSHVQHIVSSVEGELLANLSNIDILCATFPAGTLTGAPKVRAMELIDQVEPVKRGIYGGAVGYISFNGEMDVAITIRTA
ncbi:hypothetical protein ACTFIZ_012372 [Dictyostelium cf. discoideum]